MSNGKMSQVHVSEISKGIHLPNKWVGLAPGFYLSARIVRFQVKLDDIACLQKEADSDVLLLCNSLIIKYDECHFMTDNVSWNDTSTDVVLSFQKLLFGNKYSVFDFRWLVAAKFSDLYFFAAAIPVMEYLNEFVFSDTCNTWNIWKRHGVSGYDFARNEAAALDVACMYKASRTLRAA